MGIMKITFDSYGQISNIEDSSFLVTGEDNVNYIKVYSPDTSVNAVSLSFKRADTFVIHNIAMTIDTDNTGWWYKALNSNIRVLDIPGPLQISVSLKHVEEVTSGNNTIYTTTKKIVSTEIAAYVRRSVSIGDEITELEAVRAALEDDIADVQSVFQSHTGSNSNPHLVTKAQVGLGNVENKTIDSTPTANSGNYISSGAVKTIQNTIDTHVDNTSNPHSVTKAQVGLGSVANEPMDDTPTQGSTHYVSSGGVKSNCVPIGRKIADIPLTSDVTTNDLKQSLNVPSSISGLTDDTDTATPIKVATKATNDSDGNSIKTTYAKSADLTSGTVTVNKATNDKDGNDITTTYVKKANVVDNLTSTDTDKPLSANQGRLLKGLVDGRSVAKTFNDYESMVTFLQGEESASLKVGDIIYVKTMDVPDIWIASVGQGKANFTYTTDEALEETLTANDEALLIGFYELCPFESKIDLSDYVEKETGKSLSTNDYDATEKGKVASNTESRHSHLNKTILDNTTASFTTDLKSKLDGVEAGAEPNVIETIKVNGTEVTPTGKEVNITISASDKPNLVFELAIDDVTQATATEKSTILTQVSGVTNSFNGQVNTTLFNDIILKTGTNTVFEYHYSSFTSNEDTSDYIFYFQKDEDTMIKIEIDNGTTVTLCTISTSVPTISTSISDDNTSDTKTASPKAVKTYVDSAINNFFVGLNNTEWGSN